MSFVKEGTHSPDPGRPHRDRGALWAQSLRRSHDGLASWLLASRGASCCRPGGDPRQLDLPGATIKLTRSAKIIDAAQIIAVISVAGHTGVRYPTGPGFIQQRQGQLRFGLKPDCGGDVRLLAPRLIRRPLLRQVQPCGHRPGQRALGVMTIDRDLAVGHFARRSGILARHPDRVAPALLKPGIIKNEHAIAFPGQRLHPGDPLPIERGLIPDHVGQQVVELLLVGLRHNLSQGVTVFVGMLTEQAGKILTQGFGTRPLGKMHPQRRQKLGQLRQSGARRADGAAQQNSGAGQAGILWLPAGPFCGARPDA